MLSRWQLGDLPQKTLVQGVELNVWRRDIPCQTRDLMDAVGGRTVAMESFYPFKLVMVQPQNLREKNAKFATSIKTRAVLAPPENTKIVCVRGSAPDPAGELTTLPQTP